MQSVKYRNTSNVLVCISEHWDILEQEAPFIVPTFLLLMKPRMSTDEKLLPFQGAWGYCAQETLLGAGLGFLNLNFQLTGGTLLIAAVLRLFWIAV